MSLRDLGIHVGALVHFGAFGREAVTLLHSLPPDFEEVRRQPRIRRGLRFICAGRASNADAVTI